MKKILTVAAVAAVASTGAFAEGKSLAGFGAGAHAGWTNFDAKGDHVAAANTQTADLSGRGYLGGLDLSWDQVAGNLFYGAALDLDLDSTKGKVVDGNTTEEFKRKSGLGLNAKVGMVFGDTAVYGLAGFKFAKLEAQVKANNNTFKATNKHAYTLGLGTKTALDGGMYIGLQAQRDFYKNLEVKNGAGAVQVKLKAPRVDSYRVNLGWTF